LVGRSIGREDHIALMCKIDTHPDSAATHHKPCWFVAAAKFGGIEYTIWKVAEHRSREGRGLFRAIHCVLKLALKSP
jgi:hypothetical protein